MSNQGNELRVFAYLTADRRALYRSIMTSFMEERDRFALHLRAREVADLLSATHPDSSDETTIEGALQKLCDWGNLERHQDTSDVRTVEEFYRPRYLYQLTREGEEAERAVSRYLAAIVEGGELQTAALSDIRKLLGELAALVKITPLDGSKAFDALTQLRSRFEDLTSRAQTFMSSLQRSIDLRETQEEVGLIQYKEVLIQYLQKFVLELRVSAADVADRILEIEDGDSSGLLEAAALREMVDSLDQSEENRSRVLAEWTGRWRGLRLWFLGDLRQIPRAEMLRRKALSAISQLLGAISRVNDRRISRTDRVTDLRVLARWFAETDTDSQAHRLWMAAFGLTPSRHLTIDSESLVEREAKPVRPQTSWVSAPAITITPRLRTTGFYTRRGPGKAVIDRSQQKAYLAAMVKEEAAQLEAARAELLAKGETRLTTLGPLSGPGFNLFLDLLADALAGNAEEGKPIEVRSTDGTLSIRLVPTLDGQEARIETPSGTFSGPDHFIHISEDSADAGAARTSVAVEARL